MYIIYTLCIRVHISYNNTVYSVCQLGVDLELDLSAPFPYIGLF